MTSATPRRIEATGPRRAGRRLPPAVAILMLAAAGFAPAPASETDTVVRVRAVEYSLVVLDGEDRPVDEVTPADLTVSYQGELLPFRLVDPMPSVPPAPIPDVKLNLRLGSDEKLAVSAPVAPRYYLFFIDLTADSLTNRKRAREAVVEYMRETLSRQDLAGVVSFNGNLMLELPFHPDLDRVEQAIGRAYERPKASGLGTRQRIHMLLERIGDCEKIPDFPGELRRFSEDSEDVVSGALAVHEDCVADLGSAYVEENRARAQAFLDAMEGAMRVAGGLRGRATILAVTHGASLEPDSEFIEAAQGIVGLDQIASFRQSVTSGEPARAQLDRLIAQANHERVTVHVVDPAAVPTGARGASQRGLLLQGSSPVELAHRLPQSALRQLTDATGGVYLPSTDILAGLRAVREIDSRARRHVLVYLPDHVEAESLRKVAISSTRPGTRVSHTLGFPEGRGEAASAELEIGEARPIAGAGSIYVPFRLGVLPADLGYREDGDNMVADLTLHVLVENDAGRHLTSGYHFFRHAFPRSQWEERKARKLAVRGWLEAPAGSYRLAAVFRNARSGNESRLQRRLALVE